MSMRTYRIRLFLLGCLSLLMFTAILIRLYYLQIIRHEEYSQFARQQQNMLVQLIPRRGDITDRNGLILATSHFSNNIILDTAKFIQQPRPGLVREMAEIFNRSEPSILDLFSKQTRRHILATTATQHLEKRVRQAMRTWQKQYKLPEGAIIIEKTGSAPDAPRTILLDTEKFKINVNPRMIKDLARIVKKPEASLQELFKRPRRHIIARMATPEVEAKVREAQVIYEEEYGVPHEAILFEQNSERETPNDSLASHIVGYTNIDDNGDNIGKSGVEREYDKYLKGSISKQSVPVTNSRKGLAPLKEDVIEATYGNNVVLTIDQRIQMFTEAALQKRVGEVQGNGGIAIVMDVKTGEILALASCPDFNLSNYAKADPAQLRNRTLTDPIEIGSVMKIITTTLLIENNLLTPDEPIDCQGGRGSVKGRRMTDSHHLGVVPFREAFAASSNIGLATVGLRLEPKLYYNGLLSFGLGQLTGVDLPGEGPGILRPLDRWTDLTRTSLPIGYECSLTAMEVISALGAVGNDGIRLRPHVVKEIRTHKGDLVKRFEPEMIEKIASPETCRTVRQLMEGVVMLPMGTGKVAQIPGYRIGGKTGTTIKTPPGVTPKKYIASFAGLLPIDEPRLAFYIYVDDPKMGDIFGGAVSGPIFKDIALHATHILGIPPSDPVAFASVQKTLDADMMSANATAHTSETQAQLAAQLAAEDNAPTEAFQEEAFQETATPEDLLLPRMPDCHSQTIPEAWKTLSDAGITSSVKTRGSGLVVHQEPPPGAPVRPLTGVTLIFALPSEASKTIGAEEPIHAQ